ncbi:hypothetical protein LguiB_020636 [Lonicera macranthoides]
MNMSKEKTENFVSYDLGHVVQLPLHVAQLTEPRWERTGFLVESLLGGRKEHENQVAGSTRGTSLTQSTSKRGLRAKNMGVYVGTMNTVTLRIKQMAEAMERKSQLAAKKEKLVKGAAIDP